MGLQAELEPLFADSYSRAAAILAGRYEEGRTFRDIGLQFGVTRERIRQIEAAALQMLRHPSRREAVTRAVARDSRLWEKLFPNGL